MDVGDGALSAAVHRAMQTERGRPSNIGRRLQALAQSAGLTPVARTEATHTWDAWNPDATPAPDGCFSMQSLADDLVDRDLLAASERDRFVLTVQEAARRGEFSMRLTMYAVVAVAATARR